MQIHTNGLGVGGWPRCVSAPSVRTALKCSGAPRRLLALAVQVIAEKWSFDIFAEFTRGFVTAKWDQPNAVAFGRLPLPVEPRSRDHEVSVVGIFFRGVPKNLP